MDTPSAAKKPRLGGPLILTDEQRAMLESTPPHRLHTSKAEGDKPKPTKAEDEAVTRARCRFFEEESDDGNDTTAIAAKETQQLRPHDTHAAKVAAALKIFEARTTKKPTSRRVDRAALQKAIDFYASYAAKKKSGPPDVKENKQLMLLAKEMGMKTNELESWIESIKPYLKEWKLCVIDEPKQRKGLLAILDPKLARSVKVPERVADLCFNEGLDILNCDPKGLNISCRCARAAAQIVLHGKAAGGLADSKRPLFNLWRHQCAVRLLIAITAEFLERTDGYFVDLLGDPVPHMKVKKKCRGVTWD